MAAQDLQRIGQLIRGERRAQGLTQDDLALLADLSRKTVADVERGKPTVQLATLLQILDALGLNLDVRKGVRGG
jgi:HTH-type transcriptional regulator/antitoxin HipB